MVWRRRVPRLHVDAGFGVLTREDPFVQVYGVSSRVSFGNEMG